VSKDGKCFAQELKLELTESPRFLTESFRVRGLSPDKGGRGGISRWGVSPRDTNLCKMRKRQQQEPVGASVGVGKFCTKKRE